MTKTADDFRIEEVRAVTLNGSKKIAFKAFERRDGMPGFFVCIGQFSAPARTAKRDLWKIAAEREAA